MRLESEHLHVTHLIFFFVSKIEFDIDITTCSECGSDVKIIASIEDPAVIQKILAHMDDNVTISAAALLPDCRASPTAGLFI